MKPGLVIKERRLVPIAQGSRNSKLEKLLGNIQRSTLKDEVLVCALVSPDGEKGVFLDDTGREYQITDKELSEKLTYISAKYVKKQVQHYSKAKKGLSQYEKLVRDFIERPDTTKRYKDWVAPEGYEDEVEIPAAEVNVSTNEEVMNEEKLNLKKLKTDIEKAALQFVKSKVDDENPNDYFTVEIRDKNGEVCVEVRTELSHSTTEKLANGLDKVISKYDDDAYFDMEDAGIIQAYIFNKTNEDLNEAVTYFDKAYKEAYKIIGDDQLRNIPKDELDGKTLIKEVEWAIYRLGMDLDDILDPDDEKDAVKKINTEIRQCKRWLQKWKSLSEEDINEEQKYKVGKNYISDDGKFKFKVLKVTKSGIQILSYEDNKKYTVEISELDLANAELDESTDSSNIATKVDTDLDEGRVKGSIIEVGDKVKYDSREFTVTNIDGRYYELQPEDKRRKPIYATRDIVKVDEDLNEEYNPFSELKRLPDDTEMRKGLFTDGNGGVYEAPKTGRSKLIKVDNVYTCYDFKTKSLVVLDKKKNEILNQNLSLSAWLDNPEYWVETYLNSEI